MARTDLLQECQPVIGAELGLYKIELVGYPSRGLDIPPVVYPTYPMPMAIPLAIGYPTTRGIHW